MGLYLPVVIGVVGRLAVGISLAGRCTSALPTRSWASIGTPYDTPDQHQIIQQNEERIKPTSLELKMELKERNKELMLTKIKNRHFEDKILALEKEVVEKEI